MATGLSKVGRLAIRILLVQSSAQALQLYQAPAQIIAKLDDAPRNGTAVPGDSPVKYHNNPGGNLFIIESLDMHPNPCVIESYCGVIIHGTFTESLVNTTPHLSFNVTSHFPDGREGLVPGEDDLCNWVDIVQDDPDSDSTTAISSLVDASYDINDLAPDPDNPLLYRFKRNLEKRKDKRSCPPKKGKATITSTILLLGGYVPEANYTAKVRATEKGKRGGDGHGGGRGGEGRTLWDLWTEFELKYKEGYLSVET